MATATAPNPLSVSPALSNASTATDPNAGNTSTVSATPPAITTGSATPNLSPLNIAQNSSISNANVTNAIQPPTGTVAGNVSSLIDQNSPLMQRAAAKAMEAANSRGLINSSMAIGDAQNAVIANATPIAQSDAASANQFALTNANAANTASQFNASQTNTVNTNNAQAMNTATNQQAAQASSTAQQANSSMQTAATEHDRQVAAIQSDPNMTTDAKNAAIATLNANYLSFQQGYSALVASGVPSLLDFSASGHTAAAGSTATPGSDAASLAAQQASAAASAGVVTTGSGITYDPKTGMPANASSWDALAKPIQTQLASTPSTITVPGTYNSVLGITSPSTTAPNPAYTSLQQQLSKLGPRPAA